MATPLCFKRRSRAHSRAPARTHCTCRCVGPPAGVAAEPRARAGRERRVAALAGKEAALFVPSGTMGNQIAVKCLTAPGEEVLLEAHSHINFFEQGGIAANSGCLAHPVETERGMIAPEDLAAALRADDDHVARVTLVCVENTHNWHGGTGA